MLTILIFKWLFILFTVVLSVYHYALERKKLNKIAKHIHDPALLSELRASASNRMAQFLLLFAAFIIWIMSYDLEIEKVNAEKTQLANELQNTSKTYANLSESQSRLTKPKTADKDELEDIKSYYTDVFVNYYVMRKCQKTGTDDIFIINSALTREIGLNNIPLNTRDDIIQNAKTAYLKKFSNVECRQINSNYKDIINNYNNYIAAVREVLRATF